MAKFNVLLLSLVLTIRVFASTFFMPDSDTAALVALVSNTASTVSNTLKILEVAEKTSEQIDKYNFLAMRRYFVARRIEQHVQDIIEVGKMRPKDLNELNQAMMRLKINLRGLKTNIDYIAKDVYAADDFTARYWDKVSNSMGDEKESEQQEIMSADEGQMSKHVQNTAMNTALSANILAKTRRDNIEYQKIDIALKKDAALERLRSEVFYRDWLGINNDLGPLQETL
ncbi:MAG: hypothetical protein A2504_00365 [Bdellovibrionales bacterium RIFOXYD12_FULL_39_22]|nr:MAG: hypothetical protein A2385_13945 [Bdellovibrionales bacterium RIFOXYB1_FULL_39_21]OFZ42434.1 MAG: hypothetical protein A2485_03995 [Bdellovibrionales bacterium RIFOXYC12_FULL_39_17]OFZ45410.1 MAG: hypothetical protein A2404_01435 [Bdellovibrionales bacterium RIFOXYC1_FULL_39_130]OFZ68430.1 MAG: hypothetical protein A2451_01610 [Bdellovibrionales bacterium RIFOXYC2_FULL_39_8]OFZ74607.1 MAG: hypothetical protein A2560_09465 [Bdellovibrionales bacterium RIFOXYD1_FULL_39_84]OFZ92889.1 MAG: